ncbi:hypothetical protein PtB15_3B690 [Puccinia triticina]|nr:hypothetical protein PtB15_3B690 [Puccinia triticina]
MTYLNHFRVISARLALIAVCFKLSTATFPKSTLDSLSELSQLESTSCKAEGSQPPGIAHLTRIAENTSSATGDMIPKTEPMCFESLNQNFDPVVIKSEFPVIHGHLHPSRPVGKLPRQAALSSSEERTIAHRVVVKLELPQSDLVRTDSSMIHGHSGAPVVKSEFPAIHGHPDPSLAEKLLGHTVPSFSENYPIVNRVAGVKSEFPQSDLLPTDSSAIHDYPGPPVIKLEVPLIHGHSDPSSAEKLLGQMVPSSSDKRQIASNRVVVKSELPQSDSLVIDGHSGTHEPGNLFGQVVSLTSQKHYPEVKLESPQQVDPNQTQSPVIDDQPLAQDTVQQTPFHSNQSPRPVPAAYSGPSRANAVGANFIPSDAAVLFANKHLVEPRDVKMEYLEFDETPRQTELPKIEGYYNPQNDVKVFEPKTSSRSKKRPGPSQDAAPLGPSCSNAIVNYTPGDVPANKILINEGFAPHKTKKSRTLSEIFAKLDSISQHEEKIPDKFRFRSKKPLIVYSRCNSKKLHLGSTKTQLPVVGSHDNVQDTRNSILQGNSFISNKNDGADQSKEVVDTFAKAVISPPPTHSPIIDQNFNTKATGENIAQEAGLPLSNKPMSDKALELEPSPEPQNNVEDTRKSIPQGNSPISNKNDGADQSKELEDIFEKAVISPPPTHSPIIDQNFNTQATGGNIGQEAGLPLSNKPMSDKALELEPSPETHAPHIHNNVKEDSEQIRL